MLSYYPRQYYGGLFRIMHKNTRMASLKRCKVGMKYIFWCNKSFSCILMKNGDTCLKFFKDFNNIFGHLSKLCIKQIIIYFRTIYDASKNSILETNVSGLCQIARMEIFIRIVLKRLVGRSISPPVVFPKMYLLEKGWSPGFLWFLILL